MKNRTIVIGAGPAGFMSAISAAQNGDEVTLLEQLDRVGCKLLATGGGRCNLTNTSSIDEMARAFGRNGRFMLPALYTFAPEDLIDFFESRGVKMILSDNFHYFPKSGRAQDILETLINSCKILGVKIKSSCTVKNISHSNGKVTGVELSSGKIPADKVIIACGGLGYPKLGATGSGYRLAKKLGHSIKEPVPAMVGLQVAEPWVGDCRGISLTDAESWIDLPQEKSRCRGELLFTHQGISAFAVLDISGRISELLLEHQEVPIKVNLFTERKASDWLQEFDQWQTKNGTHNLNRLLSNYMPIKLANYLLDEQSSTKAAQFSSSARQELAQKLTALPLTVINTEGWNRAMVTRGGVNLSEVDSNTLESKLTAGLYFTGEVLDLDGPCGGYNLQWAFSSGALAGGGF